MPPAKALHRHQSSLEGIIDFTKKPPLTQTQRLSASRQFNQLASYFDVSNSSNKDYDHMKLMRFTYKYTRSKESKDNFLRAFFKSTGLSININKDINLSDTDRRAELRNSFFNFADLPLISKTPQPSPASHSAVQRAQGGEGHNFLSTPERLSTLRGAYLIRDRHRYIITRRFDNIKAFRRIHNTNRDSTVAKDNDRSSLEEEEVFDTLEVAHILPHSLTQFGDFQIFFEPIDHQQHTYYINTFMPMILKKQFPITRTLYLTKSRTINPPSPRLLAIHNAIAHILHLSATGEYINRILRDLEQHSVREDGSTEIDRFVKLRLDGCDSGSLVRALIGLTHRRSNVNQEIRLKESLKTAHSDYTNCRSSALMFHVILKPNVRKLS
ncbi:uncharacterized protein NECHADRAFT_98437 [Fusarium vanettenii 77-13-4]|uniref:HNH nuclease domain-containing protein n=1 Tax=Fusarium vanettenii (strain ATCC MYA-4622 / CBS 123669 / FGSC 9596 / NRRL 45880 / 77-13-4) TaxID=660122 RepID=C7ZR43_FUSV7|nr:uncharacterized protein NECHADRAFT_98437 [Fusarium vanettenii 77-13-4]EEU33516.1 hypothetical protein NECHADRAFT_98437 [Fusarium vanettenii 77-13-4]